MITENDKNYDRASLIDGVLKNIKDDPSNSKIPKDMFSKLLVDNDLVELQKIITDYREEYNALEEAYTKLENYFAECDNNTAKSLLSGISFDNNYQYSYAAKNLVLTIPRAKRLINNQSFVGAAYLIFEQAKFKFIQAACEQSSKVKKSYYKAAKKLFLRACEIDHATFKSYVTEHVFYEGEVCVEYSDKEKKVLLEIPAIKALVKDLGSVQDLLKGSSAEFKEISIDPVQAINQAYNQLKQEKFKDAIASFKAALKSDQAVFLSYLKSVFITGVYKSHDCSETDKMVILSIPEVQALIVNQFEPFELITVATFCEYYRSNLKDDHQKIISEIGDFAAMLKEHARNKFAELEEKQTTDDQLTTDASGGGYYPVISIPSAPPVEGKGETSITPSAPPAEEEGETEGDGETPRAPSAPPAEGEGETEGDGETPRAPSAPPANLMPS